MSRYVAYLCATLTLAGSVHAQQPEFTVQTIFGGDAFSAETPSIAWMADGRHYAVLERGPDGTTNLYSVDARSGDRTMLVRGRDLVPPGGSASLTIEDYAFSPDSTVLLIYANSIRVWRRNTKGKYYLWDFARRSLRPLSAVEGYQQFAKFSPDGRYIGFVRSNNLFVHDRRNGEERQLTVDGSDDIINGTTDWVYEEELDLRDAYRFSPDGSRIVFWRFDQSAIKPFYLIDETTLYPTLVPVRYPKAGTRNSSVRLGVVEIASGRTTWMDLGPEPDMYVAEGGIAGSPDEVWFTRLNRYQNRLDLVLADVRTGVSRVVMSDRDSAWVDANVPRWLDGGRRFLFPSERDGYRQLFLFNRNGDVLRKITTAPWDVTEVFGVDEPRAIVYFSGTGEGPRTRPIYAMTLDGGHLRQVTPPGGWHDASFGPHYDLFVDTYSTATMPPAQVLYDREGRHLRTIGNNEEMRRRLEALALVPPEFTEVPGADGVSLGAFIVKPPHFDPTKQYPLLMYVYGGPGSQTVTDRWGGTRYLWHQMLAREGYVVASVDNRGTGARGRDFKKMTYRRLGYFEPRDQIAAAQYLAGLSWIDEDRLGIWGWSYGGYMSLLSMFQGEGVFRAAISVAPVTDWQLYDTIYTERYMRTPQENPEGYERGAPVSYADRLQGKLLVVHGTGDDNVHSQNTTWLVRRLEEAGKQFDLRLYPNKTHSIAGARTRVNLYGLFTEWLEENLKPGPVALGITP